MKRRELRKNGRRDGMTAELFAAACMGLAIPGAIGAVILLYLLLGGCGLADVHTRALEHNDAMMQMDRPTAIEQWRELQEYRQGGNR